MQSKGSVLQEWMGSLTWRAQATILAAIRGPDVGCTESVKRWVRWIRRTTLRNADPNSSFMRATDPPTRIAAIVEKERPAFDGLPVHFVAHFSQALQLIGEFHPEIVVANLAMEAYLDLCDYLHLNPENRAQVVRRMRDLVGDSEKCQTCDGTGEVRGLRSDGGTVVRPLEKCPDCNGPQGTR